MRKLIILAAVAACCLAAPTSTKLDAVGLERPSPINPEVPMEPKPAEKITMITDPKKIAQHMQETDAHVVTDHVSPTVKPESSSSSSSEHPHGATLHRQKRDEKPRDPTKVQPLKEVPKPVATTTAKPPPKPVTTPKRTYRPRTTVIPKRSEPIREPAKHRSRRSASHEETPTSTTPVSVPRPLISRDQHHVPLQVPQTLPAHLSTTGHDHQLVRPQTLPAFLPIGQATPVDEHKLQTLPALNHAIQAQTHPEHVDAKRDIPVPLVPKHHHPEESPKDDEKKPEMSHEERKQQPKEAEHAVKREDVQVEDLSDAVPHQQPLHRGHVQQMPGSHSQEHGVHQSQEHGLHQSQEHAVPQSQDHGVHQPQDHGVHQSQEHGIQEQHDVQHLPHLHQPPHSQEHHFQPTHPHMPHHVEDSSVTPSTTTTTTTTSTSTEHPVLRPKPVPVAELFGRPHEQQ